MLSLFKKLAFTLMLFSNVLSQAFAQGEPLTIAITDYDPPFVMQGANQQLFGYDISLMHEICKTIKRSCTFQKTTFDRILPMVANKQVDVGISSISITADRAQIVLFSIPYMLSKGAFITTASNPTKTLSPESLKNKKVGIIKGSIFANEVNALNVGQLNFIGFKDQHSMIDSLAQGNINYAIIDSPSAVFWVNHSSGILKTIGEPFNVGYGYGIAMERTNNELLQQINAAINQLQDSGRLAKLYRKFFEL